MEEKDLINQIVLLKEIKPDEQWAVSCRARLAFRMEMERKKALLNKDVFALKEIFTFLRERNPNRAFRAVYALVIAFAFIVSGGGLTALAAMKSLPGSPFYPVKLALEKARMMTTSKDGQIKLQTEIASRRLDELKQVVEAPDPAEQKNAKMEQVVGQIQRQLADFSDQLPSQSKSVATAKIVGDKASQIEKALTEAKNNPTVSGDKGLSDKISEAANAADKTGTQALEIMADQHNESNQTQKEDIAMMIEAKINNTKAKIKLIEEKFSLNGIKANLTIGAILVTDKSVVADQLNKATGLLDKAEESLAQNDVSVSLKLFEQAKEMVNAAEKIAEIGSVSQTNDINSDNTATSSSAVK